ncbi:MAG: hypothetical protein AAF481_13700 [Acidobacteriota bacterium]
MSEAMTSDSLNPAEVDLPESWVKRLPVVGFALAIIGGVLTAVLAHGHGHDFYFSYLVAYLYFLSIALGGLFFVLVQHATRAGWSTVVRRLAEDLMGTLPLFALLFIPIFLGAHDLYHWTHADVVAADPILQGKTGYLNEGFFTVRAVIYLATWTALAIYFRRRSIAQDSSGDVSITRRLQTLSAPALVAYALTQSFAAFDWLMSLDPHWYSTIFPVYFFAGCVVAILAVLVVLTMGLQRSGALTEVVTTEHFHDIGKLLFGFVVFWAYIGFSQYMLIWYGNIPEETLWFAHRLEHGWRPWTVLLVVGHFVIPFLYLVSRHTKRRRSPLLIGALWLLVMHFVDLYWLVMPVAHPHATGLGLLDIAAWLAVGGLFLGTLGLLLRRRALVPVRDPRLAESLAFENM